MAAILEIRNLHRHFGGIAAINGLSLTLSENELQSVIGPNGAGKTTLFNVITGRLHASSGQVFYEGQEITNKPPDEIVRLGISRTFQKSSIFPGHTVFENLRIARQAKLGGSRRIFSSKDRLKQVNEDTRLILERLRLADQAKTIASALSHGDQRVMEIGIALAGSPRLLLLDEPTAGMSPRETERTAELIRNLAKELTVVLVEHDMEVVMSISDRISVMHQGSLIAEGTPVEIQSNELVREAYLGKEA
jgi:branched-chain amino acid transport system ATP-binding protein